MSYPAARGRVAGHLDAAIHHNISFYKRSSIICVTPRAREKLKEELEKAKDEIESAQKAGRACGLCGQEKLKFQRPVISCDGEKCRPTSRTISTTRTYYASQCDRVHYCQVNLFLLATPVEV